MTTVVILSNPLLKKRHVRFTMVLPKSIILLILGEDINFLSWKLFNYNSFSIISEATNVKPKIKIISFKKQQKHEYIKFILDQTNLLRVPLWIGFTHDTINKGSSI